MPVGNAGSTPAAHARPACGEIFRGAMYSTVEIRHRLGLGDWAWRKMRRNGLQVAYVSGKSFVYGDDLIDFILSKKCSENARSEGPRSPSLLAINSNIEAAGS